MSRRVRNAEKPQKARHRPPVALDRSANFWIADADAAAAKAGELGGRVVVEPHDTPGFREAVLADPQGAVFSVSQLLTGN
jgi:predicted enzyme related to lactoylglutathione lyase